MIYQGIYNAIRPHDALKRSSATTFSFLLGVFPEWKLAVQSGVWQFPRVETVTLLGFLTKVLTLSTVGKHIHCEEHMRLYIGLRVQ